MLLIELKFHLLFIVFFHIIRGYLINCKCVSQLLLSTWVIYYYTQRSITMEHEQLFAWFYSTFPNLSGFSLTDVCIFTMKMINVCQFIITVYSVDKSALLNDKRVYTDVWK